MAAHARRLTGPTAAELAAAANGTVADLVGPDMQVLLCGINPSLYSAATGHHFGRPANRLWATLHGAGFTARRLHPTESASLLAAGIGVTNLVARATAAAADLDDAELRVGIGPLTALVHRWRPAWVAFLGLSAYRVAFDRPRAGVGPTGEQLGPAGVWVLPNPSGLNAHYQLPDLVAAYADLRRAAFGGPG